MVFAVCHANDKKVTRTCHFHGLFCLGNSSTHSVELILSRSQKNSKLAFYFSAAARSLIPNHWFRNQLSALIENIDEDQRQYIESRVAYYNRCLRPFELGEHASKLACLSPKQQSAYFYDLRDILRYFPAEARFHHEFGDVIKVPELPCVVKSRPIDGDNKNAIILKLNRVRHYVFVRDTVAFADKKNMAVWRGKAKPQHPRARLVQDWFRHPRCDVGQSNKAPIGENPRQRKETLSINEQLQFKYIISVEGNDVATNLKWIMSSNSLCFMRKPRYETWFMEGLLEAGVHYVQLNDDFSDIDEKMRYYNDHPDEALSIIRNGNRWVEQFRDEKRERLIALLVMHKYFDLAGEVEGSIALLPSRA